MGDVVAGLMRLVVQVALLLVGLVVALSLVLAAAVLAVVFGLRLLWARLTGRPFVLRFGGMGVDPVASWRRYQGWQRQQAARRGPAQPSGAASPAARPPGAISDEVEDVEIKQPR